MRECPAGCGRFAGPGKLLCGPCWSTVPEPLQAAVMRAWRRYRRLSGVTTPHADRRQARLDYQAARDAAIASVA